MPSLYLLVLIGVIGVPLAFSWHPKLRFVDRWRAFGPACLIVAAGFLAWDALFTWWGVWGFNDAFLLGWRVAGLPIEEWLFFVCVPYACVFTYHALRSITASFDRSAFAASAVLLVITIGLLVAFSDRAYTATTAALLIPFLAWMLWRRPAWSGRFWLAFLILLVPFVLSNGVLTGLRFWEYPILNLTPDAVSDQIVWYNNGQNLGIRLFSIPLDDFLYGFLLIGLNVALFEFFSGRKIQSSSASTRSRTSRNEMSRA